MLRRREQSYSSSSEYVRHLIRRDRAATRLRQELLAGLGSPPLQGDARELIDQLANGLGGQP
ncbi:MAG: hypothetical protein LBS27_03815 [Bifidobacteriaceae bacterium]|jgi:Arc/MetJ-type ribon-helix-helix transcriptional regulator|nr:hypothetical protein [Bifidobacteriaceae bacterium]